MEGYRYYVGPMEPQEAEETASKISQFELFTLSNQTLVTVPHKEASNSHNSNPAAGQQQSSIATPIKHRNTNLALQHQSSVSTAIQQPNSNLASPHQSSIAHQFCSWPTASQFAIALSQQHQHIYLATDQQHPIFQVLRQQQSSLPSINSIITAIQHEINNLAVYKVLSQQPQQRNSNLTRDQQPCSY